MSKALLIHAGVAETCVALVRDGVLERYWQEQTIGRAAGDIRSGDIVLARVGKVLPSMEAAFVDIGARRDGFLAAKDARGALREGETVLVQVTKEPIGDKGARLTRALAIPGRYLVLMPEAPGVSVSRRIGDDTERVRLGAIVTAFKDGHGYIVRTAGSGASAAALAEDAARLTRIWRDIAAAREKASAPSILYREIGLVERVLRDEADAEIGAVLIDDPHMAERVRGFAQDAVPALTPQVTYWKGVSLFEAHGVEDAIAALADRRVDLPSGGWITIETTEALIAIDVNSGGHAGRGSHDDASLAVNLEAAETIARQLSLRELGGLIVVDFIPVSDPARAARVVDALRAAMARDGTPAEISPVSKFGLVAITRKREREPLSVQQSEPCACCDGHGRRKSAASVALEILRRVEQTAAAAPGKAIAVFAATDVAEWLSAHDDAIAPALARRGARWRVVAETERARASFSVET